MSKVETLRCDGCKKLRLDDANHWLEGVMDKGIIHIAQLGGLFSRHSEDGIKHFCGASCVLKWTAEQLSRLHTVAELRERGIIKEDADGKG